MPEYFQERHETSVCHLDGCADNRVWHLAATRRADKTLKARVDFLVAYAIDQSLSCVSAPEDGFCEHAVLIDWPDDKEARKLITVQLASRVGGCMLPPDDVARLPEPM